MEYDIMEKKYRITLYKNILTNPYDSEKESIYNEVDYFKQEKIMDIGSSDNKTPMDACSPKFNININGKKTLTFNIYFKFLNYETNEYELNPIIGLINNDSLIELQYGDEYYNLIITKIQQNSDGSVYNYTAEDLSIIELGKNGFSVELSTDLENNMGTVNELGEYILATSDWKVAPKEGEGKYHSDTIIQTLEDAIYVIENVKISKEKFSKRTNYLPDKWFEAHDYTDEDINGTIYAFYTDIEDYKTNKIECTRIGFLYCGTDEYELNADGVICNSYNYYTEIENIIEYIDSAKISEARGRRVVQSIKMGYDNDLEHSVTYYYNITEPKELRQEYYGYSETDYNSPLLAQNFLSNSSNMTSLEDWTLVNTNEKPPETEAELLYDTMPYPIDAPYITSITAKGEILNKGIQGYRSTIKSLLEGDTYILAILDHTEGYGIDEEIIHTEDNINYGKYDICQWSKTTKPTDLSKIGFKSGIYKFDAETNNVQVYKDLDRTKLGTIFGENDGYQKFIIDNRKTFTISLANDVTKKKIYKYNEIKVNPEIRIEDLTENLTYTMGCFFDIENEQPIYEVMFFKKMVNETGELIYPGRVPSDTEELTKLYYYIYKDNNGKSELAYQGETLGDYKPIIQEDCEKINSIDGKESNYYNLLSSLTKKFECWADFIIERDEQNRLKYEDAYYRQNGVKAELSSEEDEKENHFYIKDKKTYIYLKDTKHSWIEHNEEEIEIDEEGQYFLNGKKIATKTISFFENFEKFLVDNTDPDSPLRDDNSESDFCDYYLNYLYIVDRTGFAEYPEIGPRYFVLNKNVSIKPQEEKLIHTKKLSKWVVFRDYLESKPNWAGFKYEQNVKSIQRIEDNTNFSTKVIVKNNSNEFATNKFCSIARARDNVLKDNWIIDFAYYTRHKMLDKETLNNDLYADGGYFKEIGRLNTENEALIENYTASAAKMSSLRSNWETYYLADQSAQENISDYTKKIANCGDEYKIDLINWHVGGALELAKSNQLYIIRCVDSKEDMKDTTDSSVITYGGMNKSGPALTIVYFYYGNDENTSDGLRKNHFYLGGTKPEKYDLQSVYYFIQINHADLLQAFKLKDEPVQFEVLSYYGIYNPNGDKYNSKTSYKFNATLYDYCERIDEWILKRRVYGELAAANWEPYQIAKQQYEDYVKLSEQKVKEKTALQRQFQIKYSDFLRESTWTSEDYIDDNLYYLDARDSLRSAAFPKISYTINVVDISLLEGAQCYGMKIGDYTYIEDTEFFGWDDKGKPAKEWVVVTEASYDLEQPNNNSIKIQNYKSQLEDLFTRLSANIQQLELNKGTLYGTNYIEVDGGSGNGNSESTNISNANNVLYFKDGKIFYKDSEGTKVLFDEVGLNASLLKQGELNPSSVRIGDTDNPSFVWDKNGISAYAINTREDEEGNIIIESWKNDKFTRMDQFGFYGIDGLTPEKFKPKKVEDITENESVTFGLTWDGFFFNGKKESEDGKTIVKTIINEDGIQIKKNDIGVFWADEDGNLHLAGTIDAKSGTIGGFIIDDDSIISNNYNEDEKKGLKLDSSGVIRTGKLKLDGANSEISGSNWVIRDRYAKFSNLIVQGTISTAIFEKDSVQVAGGTIIVRPSYKVLNCIQIDDYFRFTIDFDKDLEKETDLIENFVNKFINILIPNRQLNTDCFKIIGAKNTIEVIHNEEIKVIHLFVEDSEGEDKKLKELYDTYGNNNDQWIILDFGKQKSQNEKKELCIGINSTNNSSCVPSQSLSMSEIDVEKSIDGYYYYKTNNKLVLGAIPDEEKFKNIKNTYGLYADNVYLNGTLEINNGEYKAGIDTFSEDDKIFYAQKIDDDSTLFSVTKDGKLTAKNGEFSGTITGSEIISSVLRTTRIIGTGTKSYPLSIEEGGNGKGFIFRKEIEKENDTKKDAEENSYFYINSEKIKSNLPITTNSQIDFIGDKSEDTKITSIHRDGIESNNFSISGEEISFKGTNTKTFLSINKNNGIMIFDSFNMGEIKDGVQGIGATYKLIKTLEDKNGIDIYIE